MRELLIGFCLSVSVFGYSQVNQLLIKHFQANNLDKEHFYYLNTLSNKVSSKDTLNYLYAKYYLKNSKDSLFFNFYTKVPFLFEKDTFALRYAHYYFLKHNNEKLQTFWFENIQHNQEDSVNSSITLLYKKLKFDNYDECNLPNNKFCLELKKYNKLKKKKPIIAATLSTFVPGLGKLYGQRPNSAAITFFSQGVSAYQSYESIKMYGFKNAFSIFSISYFGLFYLSNIYGSYHDLIKLKKQRQKQLLLDAEKYYHINHPASLY